MELPLSHVLLITDMDDTLLRTDKSISDRNLQAIRKLRQLGGGFTIATGRSVPSYLPYHDLILPDTPVVLNNGAVLYDPYRDEIVWNSVLPETAKGYAAEIARKFPEVGVEILLGKEIFVTQMSKQIQDHMEHEHLVHTIAPIEEIPDQWYKVLYATEKERMEPLCAYLDSLEHTDVTYVTSSQYYCEMLPRNTSKGDALKILTRMEHLEQKKIYAVGDYYNDLQLLEAADVGAAVKNAPEDVRNAANLVVGSNEEDAIAEVIDYIMEHEQ
ncbi:Cof-type HAD-IIB family hydrolase [Massiliimalia massiliensis]|jgi:Cof subfamily protein (haloacid dehalogenase superfamily)|uniref:Cof-type HAD-IIB family hydrolase n=1 Tax=Massiliimalia massiliensis TaxID=1852384 RepID=UPI00098567BB|nr:Cof-type HAD-IIB family hydrolase [Massiliimalia massiliensis]